MPFRYAKFPSEKFCCWEMLARRLWRRHARSHFHAAQRHIAELKTKIILNLFIMKRHRIFIAVNLPKIIKNKLLDTQMKWADLPARWLKKNNLHITLVFIGYASDEELLEICRLAKQAAEKSRPFEIKLKRICLGPNNAPARLIWTEGEVCPEMAKLRDNLENVLLKSEGSGFNRKENRAFRPHITLARLKQTEWRKLAEKPKIDEEISLSFPVDSIEIMESHLSRSGAEYEILESVKLSSF